MGQVVEGKLDAGMETISLGILCRGNNTGCIPYLNLGTLMASLFNITIKTIQVCNYLFQQLSKQTDSL